MSTILEALRKAHAEPLASGAEAGPGILNPGPHNYLAVAPYGGHDEVRVLRRVVYGAGGVIVLLALLVVSLLLRQGAPAAALAPASATAPKVASPETKTGQATPAPAERPVQIAVLAPLAVPTEPPLPQKIEPVMIPVETGYSAVSSEESDASIQARAAQLRAQLASAAPAKPRRPAASSTAPSDDWMRDLRIGGILWDQNSPMATVEGKVVKPGSSVRGARIARINKDSIVLSMNGREYTVRQ